MAIMPRGANKPTRIAVVLGEETFSITVKPVGVGWIVSIGVEEAVVELVRIVEELVVDVMKVEAGPANDASGVPCGTEMLETQRQVRNLMRK
jgi:hypothetical protein